MSKAAKKKPAKKRADNYEEKLQIKGNPDDVLKLTFAPKKAEKKENGA